MPVGLQVFSDWGTVQIDDTYQGMFLSLASSFTLNVAPVSSGGFNCWSGRITVSGSDPIVLIGQGSAVGLLGRRSVGSGLWEFTFISSTNATFNYFVFDTGLTPGPSDYGLQVFNSAGVRIYDGANKLLRIVSIQQLSNTSAPQSFSAPVLPGRFQACILSYGRQLVAGQAPTPAFPGGAIRFFSDVVSFDGATAQCGFVQTYIVGTSNYDTAPGLLMPYAPQLIFADVTGY